MQFGDRKKHAIYGKNSALACFGCCMRINAMRREQKAAATKDTVPQMSSEEASERLRGLKAPRAAAAGAGKGAPSSGRGAAEADSNSAWYACMADASICT